MGKKFPKPLKSDNTKQFDKDWIRLSHSGRYNMENLSDTMLRIIKNVWPLPLEYSDHELQGNWSDHRECHVGGDFLLIYRLEDDFVMFVRTGTHSELFG